jgi:cytochrome c-type biogenesis protein CcmH/NrfF
MALILGLSPIVLIMLWAIMHLFAQSRKTERENELNEDEKQFRSTN